MVKHAIRLIVALSLVLVAFGMPAQAITRICFEFCNCAVSCNLGCWEAGPFTCGTYGVCRDAPGC